MRGLTKPYRPGKTARDFMDRTTRMVTDPEPDHCPIIYDYWFGGFVVGFLLGAFLL